MEFDIKKHEKKINILINNLKNEITKFKGGVINASILNNVTVEYYGSKTPVVQI